MNNDGSFEPGLTANDIAYLQHSLNTPTAFGDNIAVDDRLLIYQENFKPFYYDESDNESNAEELLSDPYDSNSNNDEQKKEFKSKKRKRPSIERHICIILGCNRPASSKNIYETCNYHTSQENNRIKRQCKNENEYSTLLTIYNPKLTNNKINKLISVQFCKNHFYRKSYRSGLCSGCYRKLHNKK